MDLRSVFMSAFLDEFEKIAAGAPKPKPPRRKPGGRKKPLSYRIGGRAAQGILGAGKVILPLGIVGGLLAAPSVAAAGKGVVQGLSTPAEIPGSWEG